MSATPDTPPSQGLIVDLVADSLARLEPWPSSSRLKDVVGAVLDLHGPGFEQECIGCSGLSRSGDAWVARAWPCPTVFAVVEALEIVTTHWNPA